MRKLLNVLMVLCLMMGLACCAKEPVGNGIEPAASAAGEERPDPEVKEEHGMAIETGYYTITVPEAWCENCICEVKDGDNGGYSLSFYGRANYAESSGVSALRLL